MVRCPLPLLGLVLMAAATGGCLGVDAIHCADQICPVGLVCAERAEKCVSQSEAAACRDRDDGDQCELGEGLGVCQLGVCEPGCGDEVRAADEECDGPDLAGLTCESFEFYTGDLGCTGCIIDTAPCAGFCGDGLISGPEACDIERSVPTCQPQGFDFGTSRCETCSNPSAGCGYIDWRSSTLGNEVAGRSFVVAVDAETLLVPSSQGVVARIVNGRTEFLDTGEDVPLLRLWAADRDNIVAISSSGRLFRFANNTWTAYPIDDVLFDVHGVSATEVYVLGQQSLYLFDGETLSLIDSAPMIPNSGQLLAVERPSQETLIFVGGLCAEAAETCVFRRGANTWQPVPEIAGRRVFGFWYDGSDNIYVAAVLPGGLFRYSLLNDSWANVPEVGPEVTAVGGSGPNFVMAHGDGGTWFFDGAEWNPTATLPPLSINLNMMGRTVLAQGLPHANLTQFDGSAWSTRDGDAGPGRAFTRVSEDGPDDLWAIAPEAAPSDDPTTLWHGNGDGWSVVELIPGTDPDPSFNDIWGDGSGDQFAVGTQGAIWKLASGVWAAMDSKTNVTLTAVGGSSATHVFAGGVGAIFRFDGSSWEPEWTGTNAQTIQSLVVDEDWAVAIGLGCTAAIRTGGQWAELPSPCSTAQEETSFLAGWASSPDDIYAISRLTVHHWDGNQWSIAMNRTNPFTYNAKVFQGIRGYSANDIFVFGAFPQHFDGTTWTYLAPPRSTAGDQRLMAAYGSSRETTFVSLDGAESTLLRLSPWACDRTEDRCDDRVDNDCDGLFDSDDPDCQP